MKETSQQMIDSIINEKAKDNPMIANLLKAKLMLKGLHPEMLANRSQHDPSIKSKLESILDEVK
jgi:hypothetical protein